MGNYKVSYGDETPKIVNTIIEISAGGRNKYETTEDGVMFLDRVNATTLAYPTDYGFIPDTLAEDGDPLDVLLLIDEPVMPGVVVKSRVIGYMYLDDDGEPDQKVLCVAADDVSKEHIQDIDDIPVFFQNKIKHFFEHIKDFKKDFTNRDYSKVTGFHNKEEAYTLINDCIKRGTQS